ncbi:SIMPL domain-containing protein [Natronomonas sp. LN261]|uniref:SIMPL domain-containing protein n=1 Tax=Natronomonas sp. LN261 TaxID=2750669 RepID=UPI0015EE8F0C|nr:SIMPL domain-containing protein [Natronomonas sp. LN261]
MQRTAIAVLVVLVSLLAMTLVGVAVVSPIGAQSPDDAADRTVSVDATGGADAPPDRAVVRVRAVAEGDDPDAVRRELATDADALRTNLDGIGLTDDDYETMHYRVRSPRVPPREEDEVPAYRGVHGFEVTLDDPDRVGEVIDATADADVEVEGIEFTLSEVVRTDLREEAIANAMSDARMQADAIARNGDLHVTSVASVDATQRNFSPVRYEGAAMATPEPESADTNVETGDVSVEYAVEVTYNATGG